MDYVSKKLFACKSEISGVVCKQKYKNVYVGFSNIPQREHIRKSIKICLFLPQWVS